MKNNLIKILIPFIAILIIFESVMLVLTLKKDKETIKSVNTDDGAPMATTTVMPKENSNSIIDLKFLSEVNEMKIGKSYKVVLNLIPKKEIALNAIDLYVKFDPSLLTISNLVSSDDIAKPNFIKVSDKKSVIAANFLFAAKDGVVLNTKGTNVLTFNVTPKKTGIAFLEIGKGDSEGNSVTIFVDKSTSKGLPFSSNKLEIKLVN